MKDTDVSPFRFIFWLAQKYPNFVFRFGYNARLCGLEMDISKGHLHIRRILPLLGLTNPDIDELTIGAIENAVNDAIAMLKREEENHASTNDQSL